MKIDCITFMYKELFRQKLIQFSIDFFPPTDVTMTLMYFFMVRQDEIKLTVPDISLNNHQQSPKENY